VSAEKKLKALIIEDEALVAMLIEDILLELGYEVAGVAGRLEQALGSVQDLAFDFAVVDLNLNGVRTYPVAEALAARGAPFLFVTGYGSAGVEEAWRGRPIVQKPFETKDLESAIKAALS
jgi:CheY-like chemotaxis protein